MLRGRSILRPQKPAMHIKEADIDKAVCERSNKKLKQKHIEKIK